MALLGQSAFLKALGWALLNSVWQMGLLWLVYLLLTAYMRKASSGLKHFLALILLSIGSISFGFTIIYQYFTFSEAHIITATTDNVNRFDLFQIFVLISKGIEYVLPYFSLLYLLTILFLFFRFTIQLRLTNRLTKYDIKKAPVDWRLYVNRIAERIGIKKDIELWLSEIVDTPMTIGFWKPVILMPIASVNGLTIQQVEAILLHELSHIRRNDYIINLFVTSVEIIMFFNPFSRLLITAIKKEREHTCDDLVLQFEYNAHSYASALLMIEQKRVMNLALAIAATGKNNLLLLDRVKRIIGKPVTSNNGHKLIGHLFSAFMLGFIAWSNPGNIIVNKIIQKDNQQSSPSVSKEVLPVYFTVAVTPSAKIKTKTQKTKEFPSTFRFIRTGKSGEQSYKIENTEGDENDEQSIKIVQAATPERLRDYSISEMTSAASSMNQMMIDDNTPYIPSSSFSYYEIADSTKPVAPDVAIEEKKSTESLRKTLKAIEEINWKDIEKELAMSGEKVNIQKLQAQIKKSLKNVDWKTIDTEIQLESLQEKMKTNRELMVKELSNSGEGAQMQEHYRNMQKKILDDQFKCKQETQKKEVELRKYLQQKKVKVKKTVTI